MFRLFCLVMMSFLFSGCQAMIKPEAMNEISNRFNIAKEQREQNAKVGKITWVQAQREIKDLDKGVKERLDATGAIHTWRYDSGDEEYYAYCIALAERLDRKQISFAEFYALRIERFNAIEARRQSQYNQQLLIQNSQMQAPSYGNQRGGVTCFKEREWTSGLNKNCVYSCLGSEAVQTVSAAELCPISIVR